MSKPSADNAKEGAAAAKTPLWKRPFALFANRARAITVALLTTNALAACGLIWLVFFYGRGKIDTEATLAAALSALDEKDFFRAKALAEALLAPEVKLAKERGGPAFVLGVVASGEADESWGPEQTEFYTVAARQLQDATRQGLPRGREAQGLYLLGRSLFLSHQLAEAKLALESALVRAPQYRAPILRLLSEANLLDDPPDWSEAARYNGELLAIGGLIPAARQRALLQRARILLPQFKFDEITQIVGEIPAASRVYPEAIAILGDVRLAEARRMRPKPETGEALSPEALAKYQEAVRLYREALSQTTLSREDARRAEFLVGQALYESGELRAAREQFIRTRKLHPQSPEGLTANVREAELSLAEQLYPETLAALARAVRAAGDPAQYFNPYLTLEQFQAQLLATHDAMLAARQFALAIELAQSIEPIVSRDHAVEFLAHGHQAWATWLLKQAETQTVEEAEIHRAEAREQLRQAGLRYEELANLRTTAKTYGDHLWASAEAFLTGADYGNAQRVLRRYLNEEARRRRPTALVNLGQTLLAENKPQEALAAFGECLEFFPRDAVAYRARLLASATHFELGELDKAADYLSDVLNDDQLTPNSLEWREALFSLGRLLHFEGRYDEAFVKLDEAVKRYPDLPQTIEARFLAAEAYRLHAIKLRDAIDEQTPETQRQSNLAEAARLFDESLTRHADLQELLLELLDRQQLTPAQQTLLRNSYFSRGSILTALERWEEAIRTYTTFTNRYARLPEVLDAYLQIARCYRRMNQPAEARATLDQAKVTLDRMDESLQFEETTSFSRTEWTDLLAWAATL